MRRVQTKQTFKLRLLAFILALAILWYSLNPALRPLVRKKKEAEPPDEKKRNVEPQGKPATLPPAFMSPIENAERLPLPDEDDDFEWPEFIDG